MRTAVRAGAVAALLAVVLGAGWAAGAAVRPAFPGGASAVPGRRTRDRDRTPDGLALVPRTTQLDPGRPGEYAFTLTGPGAHAAQPRLTVVRRDATGLQHPTPVADADGTWRAPLTLPAAGDYRVVVEVAPAGGAPGRSPPTSSRPARSTPCRSRRRGSPRSTATRCGSTATSMPGAAAQVFATVSRGGAPVTDLEPVDGAFGRLEALRADDLAPARVHPDAAPSAPTDRAGPGIAFTAEAPGAGTYRLFLDFRHGGVQRTAVFTVATGSPDEEKESPAMTRAAPAVTAPVEPTDVPAPVTAPPPAPTPPSAPRPDGGVRGAHPRGARARRRRPGHGPYRGGRCCCPPWWSAGAGGRCTARRGRAVRRGACADVLPAAGLLALLAAAPVHRGDGQPVRSRSSPPRRRRRSCWPAARRRPAPGDGWTRR